MQPYIFQQIMLSISIAAFLGFLVLQTILFAEFGLFLSPFWAVIGIIFIIERVVSVWHVGWKARLFAFLIIPELLYALILQISYLLVNSQLDQTRAWNPVGQLTHVGWPLFALLKVSPKLRTIKFRVFTYYLTFYAGEW